MRLKNSQNKHVIVLQLNISSKEDALRYFDECYGEDLEYDEDLQEWREKWEEDPWTHFYHTLDEMGDWYEDNGYHFRAEEWQHNKKKKEI